MKFTVTRSCGHEETVEIFGKASERENKLKWYTETPCKTCYKSEKNSDCKEVEMLYRDYKNEYEDCDTKPNSYNKSKKTIIVYVPAN